MEMENKYASKGVGGTALGLAIGALGVEALRGGFGNILGGANCGCTGENMPVNRYEASQAAKLADAESRIRLLESNIYTDGKIADVYERLNTKIAGVEAQICQQNVYNATNTAALNCIQGQVAQLMSLTKVVVPNSSVCPGWGDVTVSITPTTTTAG